MYDKKLRFKYESDVLANGEDEYVYSAKANTNDGTVTVYNLDTAYYVRFNVDNDSYSGSTDIETRNKIDNLKENDEFLDWYHSVVVDYINDKDYKEEIKKDRNTSSKNIKSHMKSHIGLITLSSLITIFFIGILLMSMIVTMIVTLAYALVDFIGLAGIGLIAFIVYMYIDAKHKRNQIRTHKQKQDVLSDIQEDFDLKKEAYAEYLSETDSELDMEEDEKSLDLEMSKRYNNRGDKYE